MFKKETYTYCIPDKIVTIIHERIWETKFKRMKMIKFQNKKYSESEILRIISSKRRLWEKRVKIVLQSIASQCVTKHVALKSRVMTRVSGLALPQDTYAYCITRGNQYTIARTRAVRRRSREFFFIRERIFPARGLSFCCQWLFLLAFPRDDNIQSPRFGDKNKFVGWHWVWVLMRWKILTSFHFS